MRQAGLRRLALTFLALSFAAPVSAQSPGWRYSPLPGEGDRASMGCDREASADAFTCIAVRCEADYGTGVHVHSMREGGDAGAWEITIDRETRILAAAPSDAPYGARFFEDGEWLLDRIRHGGFAIMRHVEDEDAPFAFIDLTGSFYAINAALAYCAPRLPAEAAG